MTRGEQAAEVMRLCRLFNGLLHQGEFGVVSFMLDRMDVRHGTAAELVATLRYTYAGRHELKGSWGVAARRVFAELRRRGEDVGALLRGLDVAMASRHIKFTCIDPGCAAFARTSRLQLDRAIKQGGPWCFVCQGLAVEGDFRGLDKEARMRRIRELEAKAEAALDAHNAEMARRMEAIRFRSGRVHVEPKPGVCT
jgi:hypothetical protein